MKPVMSRDALLKPVTNIAPRATSGTGQARSSQSAGPTGPATARTAVRAARAAEARRGDRSDRAAEADGGVEPADAGVAQTEQLQRG